MNKEVNDALHTLLSMALENEKYTTQKEQFDIVHKEIERLKDKILKLETDASIYKDLSNLRKDRINKALEYIYKNGIIDLNGYDLLKILAGSDEE